MIVADTNLVVYLLVLSPHTAEAEAVYRKDSYWVAPLLWRSELCNALAVYVHRGLLTVAEAWTKIQEAESVMRSSEFAVSFLSVLQLAADSGCSAYDCEFVALARELGVPLVTSDRRVLDRFKAEAISPRAFCARISGGNRRRETGPA